MKYKIEKNTVQETLILPLYSRKLCTELYPNLYRDETAVRLLSEIDYDFSEAEKNSRSLMQRFGALEVAMRQNDLAFEVQAFWGAIWQEICCAPERMSLCLRGETGLRRSSRTACGSRISFRFALRSAAFRW